QLRHGMQFQPGLALDLGNHLRDARLFLGAENEPHVERMHPLVIVGDLGMGVDLSGNRIEALRRNGHRCETHGAPQLFRVPKRTESAQTPIIDELLHSSEEFAFTQAELHTGGTKWAARQRKSALHAVDDGPLGWINELHRWNPCQYRRRKLRAA